MIGSGFVSLLIAGFALYLIAAELIRHRKRRSRESIYIGSSFQMIRRIAGAVLCILLAGIFFVFCNFLSLFKNPLLYLLSLGACLALVFVLLFLAYLDMKDIRRQRTIERHKQFYQFRNEMEGLRREWQGKP
jgi:Zn-dependent protease with chaperone function